MRWNDIPADRRDAIVKAAAVRLAARGAMNDDEDDGSAAERHITIADLADYARGQALRVPPDSIREAVRADLVMRNAFSRLMDRYAMVSVPHAAAASTGAARKRRQVELGVEIEWLDSSVEPNTVFVRVHAPASMRPVRELILLGPEGGLRGITLIDDGDEIEVLVERNSIEYSLLVNEASKLWLR